MLGNLLFSFKKNKIINNNDIKQSLKREALHLDM